MQNNFNEVDPIHQTPIEKAITKYRNQMTVRYQKFKQCYNRIHTELHSLLEAVQFSQFPADQMSHILETTINTMEAVLHEWVQKKTKHGQSDKLTFKNCWGYIDQHYHPEAEFFTKCFSIMQNCIANVCDQMRGKGNDQWMDGIQLLMSQRCILILLKRRDRGQHNNSGNYPIIRYKAIIIHADLHTELERLCPSLLISKWIEFRKQKQKQNDKHKRPTVPAKEFCGKLIKYCEYLYEKQYELVKDKLSSELVNIYDFDDQKRMVICNALQNIGNDTNKIDDILKWFGENRAVCSTAVIDQIPSISAPIMNGCDFMNNASPNSIFEYNNMMYVADSMHSSISHDNGSDYDSFSMISSTANNNMQLCDINQYQNNNTNNYQSIRASTRLTSQIRYSPMKSAGELLEENTALRTEVDRLHQIAMQYQSYYGNINFNVQPSAMYNHDYISQQPVTNNNNQMRMHSIQPLNQLQNDMNNNCNNNINNININHNFLL